MISWFTNLASTTSTINTNLNNYYTTAQTKLILSWKSNQSDMASGFTDLNNEISCLTTSLNNVFQQQMRKNLK